MADKQDIRENAMSGGTPTRLRGLDKNGNSISPTLEEVASAMPVATMEEKGMASAGQGRVEYSIVGEGSVDILLPYYGIFLFVRICGAEYRVRPYVCLYRPNHWLHLYICLLCHLT